MLPQKVFQLDYQDFSELVWQDFAKIDAYQSEKNIQFDMVLAKLRNGTVPGSMVATYLNLPMGIIEAPRNAELKDFRIFFPSEIEKKLKQKKNINILFVDSICGTGRLLAQITDFFAQNEYGHQLKLSTYCTIVDIKAKNKPEIAGLLQDRYIQPPWEWRTFTPQTHLDRLEANDSKASEENKYALGFCSEQCQKEVEALLERPYLSEWVQVFNEAEQRVQSASGISSMMIPQKPITLEEGKNKFRKFIQEKAEFIQDNGLTHFIETDIVQAMLIAQLCPVSKIIYLNNDLLFRIYANEMDKETIANLDLD
jgi:hypoxanthine phosphoribosyltransferase